MRKKNLPLTPQNVTSGAHKNVWWICKVCGYEWKTSISNRKINDYYGAAEPPVRCGVSHLSGPTEPPDYYKLL